MHILDPFAGTGTFVTRLLQSGLIKPEELAHKYRHEIHANELVLLAYYIAAINIEATYHSLTGGEYVPFEGILLTDTFQMYEKDDLVDALLVDNSARRKRQKQLNIRVIVGNPPYSVGQKSENDNNDNVQYPTVDARIRDTYAARSDATLSKGLYDSYIRAIRWASDRVGSAGIIGFVTNAGWLEANTADGLRLCLAEEFSDIYVFHLRGNQRTSGETSRKEGGKIFGSGSRAPIAISLLVKNQRAAESGRIFLHDIGDYLSREDKLDKITSYGSVAGMPLGGWQQIRPDAHGDWLRQRDHSFGRFIVLGDKNGDASKLFENFSQGVLTARDAWAYNASRARLASNMASMIDVYNDEVARLDSTHPELDSKARKERVDGFIDADPTRISWTHNIKHDLAKARRHDFEVDCLVPGLYRPFTKQWLYYSRKFNERVYQMPRIFPNAAVENLVICVTGLGETAGPTALISSVVPNYHFVAGSQCFPLYLYDEADHMIDEGLFSGQSGDGPRRRDAITDSGHAYFAIAYPDETITKQDLFYYVYGILHSLEYRERYGANLSKELPRIPRVSTATSFWAFSKAGRDLAALHLHYETVDKYPVTIQAKGSLTDADYRVEKMKFAKKKDPETGQSTNDRSTVIYNTEITLADIPEAAWDYVVNGKAALDWVMERQAVRVDKVSSIVNDANDWATETMGNPRYPLELFQRVVTVSLETQKIVAALPALDVLEN